MRSWLIRVQAPHYCAGLIVEDERCTEAAPILGWALGKPWAELRRYFARKGFGVIVMSDPRPRAR